MILLLALQVASATCGNYTVDPMEACDNLYEFQYEYDVDGMSSGLDWAGSSSESVSVVPGSNNDIRLRLVRKSFQTKSAMALHPTPVDTTEFTTEFDFSIREITPGELGSSGFALVFTNEATATAPSNVQSPGYDHLSSYVAVEFDTDSDNNYDPDSNHVGLMVNSPDHQRSWPATEVPDFENPDSSFHVTVSYAANNLTIEIVETDLVTGTVFPPINLGPEAVDIATALPGDVYVGFTAAQRANNMGQSIWLDDWTFDNPDPTCADDCSECGDGQVTPDSEEQCDQGTHNGTDSCSATCETLPSVLGACDTAPGTYCLVGPTDTITAALTAGCRAIEVQGTIVDNVVWTGADDIRIWSSSGATIMGSNPGQPVIEVTQAGLCMDNITVTGGTGATCGGGIHVDRDGDFHLDHLNVHLNSANRGGGLCLEGWGEVAGSVIENNTASFIGGGIALDLADHGGPVPDLQGLTIRDNTAKFGGGLGAFNTSTPGTLPFHLSDSTIDGNEANDHGGGMGLHRAAVNAHGLVLVTNNLANTNNSTSGGGGGIWLNRGSFDHTSGVLTIHGNTALQGGGLYAVNTAVDVQTNLNLTHNTSVLDGGGAFLTGSTSLTATSVDLSDNVAGLSGGGIHQEVGGTTVSFDSGSVLRNATGERGGGFHVGPQASLTASNLLVALNDAVEGGGIHQARNSSVVLDHATFAANTANFVSTEHVYAVATGALPGTVTTLTVTNSAFDQTLNEGCDAQGPVATTVSHSTGPISCVPPGNNNDDGSQPQLLADYSPVPNGNLVCTITTGSQPIDIRGEPRPDGTRERGAFEIADTCTP